VDDNRLRRCGPLEVIALLRLQDVACPRINLPDPSTQASRGQALWRYARLMRAEEPEVIGAFGDPYCQYSTPGCRHSPHILKGADAPQA
jgi:hypothetical protein